MSAHRQTQRERILWKLQASWPEWAPSIEMSKVSLPYNARVLEFRRQGWLIENRTETKNGTKFGSFRLGGQAPLMTGAARVDKGGSVDNAAFPEFGDLLLGRSYAE
jgi:hypothetical protein